MSQAERIGIFGDGGHAKVTVELILSLGNFEAVGYINAKGVGPVVAGLPVVAADATVTSLHNQGVTSLALGVGDNKLRVKLAEIAAAANFLLPALISPASYVSNRAFIGFGTTIFPGSIIHTDAVIGRYCIVNTSAIVEHDCQIGDGVHIGPGATLCGGVKVGEGTFLGAGAVVAPGLFIAGDCILGAGSTIISSIVDPGIYVGSPARRIK